MQKKPTSSPLFAGSNINFVKTHNQQAILMSLLYEDSISRAELAKRTSLSSATVTNIISELIEMGVVAEAAPPDTSQSPRGVGRPRRKLKLVPNARFAVGVHIGIGLFRIVITNLRAEIIHNCIVNFDLAALPEIVLADIAENINTLIQENKIERQRIIGIGVGASGLVNHETGINVLAPRLGWKHVNISQFIIDKLNFPTHVDNNVRAMAIGEAYFGSGRNAQVLAFVYGRTGIGAGFVVNGQIFRGSGAGAGEIGHTIMIPDGGLPCRCGHSGCLETLITEPVIVRHAHEIASEHPESLLAKLLNQNDADLRPIDAIFEAARQGDEYTKNMLAKRIRYLGIALANLVDVINPEMILLGGMFAEGQDIIRPIAQQVMQEFAFSGLGDKVTLQPTSFGWRAGAIGAASLALMDFFYQRTNGSL
jgi:N-acetylglucosamine repressor